eukprot:2924615-Amphidinium_carterae.2
MRPLQGCIHATPAEGMDYCMPLASNGAGIHAWLGKSVQIYFRSLLAAAAIELPGNDSKQECNCREHNLRRHH